MEELLDRISGYESRSSDAYLNPVMQVLNGKKAPEMQTREAGVIATATERSEVAIKKGLLLGRHAD